MIRGYDPHPLAMQYREMTDEEYARLKASIERLGLLHPITLYEGKVLDGVHRQRACIATGAEPHYEEYTGADPEEWVRAHNEARRHLTVAELALRAAKTVTETRGGDRKSEKIKGPIGPLIGEKPVTVAAAAEAHGVGERTVKRIKKAVDVLGDEKVEELVEQGESVHAIERVADEAQKKTERQAQKDAWRTEARAYAGAFTDAAFVADITDRATWHAQIAPASVDVILTDPPYPHAFIPLLSDLSSFAAEVLKPGGDCFVMMGQSYLLDAQNRLDEHLDYYWQMAYCMRDVRTGLRHKDVMCNWKPVLWFTNGPRAKANKFVGSDVLDTPYEAKDNHHWQQDLLGFEQLVERCTHDHAVICDPFCGSGTTLVAARNLGRKYVGFDVDPDAVAMAQRRMVDGEDDTGRGT